MQLPHTGHFHCFLFPTCAPPAIRSWTMVSRLEDARNNVKFIFRSRRLRLGVFWMRPDVIQAQIRQEHRQPSRSASRFSSAERRSESDRWDSCICSRRSCNLPMHLSEQVLRLAACHANSLRSIGISIVRTTSFPASLHLLSAVLLPPRALPAPSSAWP
jgi:hypothetical protein